MLRDKPLGGIGGLIFALFLFCGIFPTYRSLRYERNRYAQGAAGAVTSSLDGH